MRFLSISMDENQYKGRIYWKNRGELNYRVHENTVQVLGFSSGNGLEYTPIPIKLQKNCRAFLRGNPEAAQKGPRDKRVSPLDRIVFE